MYRCMSLLFSSREAGSLCGVGRGSEARVDASHLQSPASEVVDLPSFLSFFFFSVPEDLSLEEREELLDIRRRKKELIDDIEVKHQQQSVSLEFVWNTDRVASRKCGKCEHHGDRGKSSLG